MGIEQKAGDMGVVTDLTSRCGELVSYQFHVANAVWPGLLRDRNDERPGCQL